MSTEPEHRLPFSCIPPDAVQVSVDPIGETRVYAGQAYDVSWLDRVAGEPDAPLVISRRNATREEMIAAGELRTEPVVAVTGPDYEGAILMRQEEATP